LWAGRIFTPRLIAPSATGAWVAEGLLPVRARVEDQRVIGPKPVPRPGAGDTETRDLLVHEDGSIWVRFRSGVVRFDPAHDEIRSSETSLWALSSGEAGVWGLMPDGRLAQLDEQAGVTRVIGEPELRSPRLVVAGCSLWTLGFSDPATQTSTLTQLDSDTGKVVQRVELAGNSHWFRVESDRVWICVYRRREHPLPRTWHLIGVAIDSGAMASEIEVPSAVAAHGAIRGAELWFQPERGAPHDPPAVFRVDPSTGERRGTVPCPGWVHGPMYASPGGVWAGLRQREVRSTRVVFLRPDNLPSVYDLTVVELAPHLPPPPPPIDARETEATLRDRLAAEVTGGWIRRDPETGREDRRPFIRGVEFKAVRLDGVFPQTRLVLLFRAESHPGVLFGRRRRIWEDDGALSDVIDCVGINLMEDIEACGYGLPSDPVADEAGVVWF